jgi:hypothetical protein
MISDIQKQIYNLYLRAYRINNNQPFKAKKKFDDLSIEKIAYLEKLENVFKRYPAFLSNLYFDAPYKIYTDEKKFYDLKFFASSKGISTCIAYFKVLNSGNPEEQMDFIKSSYKFIAEFCVSKNIKLSQYVSYCSVSQNDCLIHLKEHKLSWYVIFSIPGFYDLLYNLPSDEFDLYFGSDISLNSLYNKYNASQKTEDSLTFIRNKIEDYLQKKLHQNKHCDISITCGSILVR